VENRLLQFAKQNVSGAAITLLSFTVIMFVQLVHLLLCIDG